jgi:hypothetical protein
MTTLLKEMTMQKTVSEIIKRTAQSRKEWEGLLALTGVERTQLLFDLSTFECNKPIVAQMYAGDGQIDPALDLNSQRRRNILLTPGTMVRFLRHHDKHDYPVPSWGLIVKSTKLKDDLDRGKEYMVAINDSGHLGGFLYVYNPWFPAFEPVSQTALTNAAVQKWLETCIAEASTSIPPHVGTLRLQLRDATGVLL